MNPLPACPYVRKAKEIKVSTNRPRGNAALTDMKRDGYLDVEVIECDELFGTSRIEDFQLERATLEIIEPSRTKMGWGKDEVAMYG
jgi:hypothetical protein